MIVYGIHTISGHNAIQFLNYEPETFIFIMEILSIKELE